MSVIEPSAHITAVLGPTNTGKTHLAIERMLGHESGMIGFPLRLLARENYDRIVARRGRNVTALITGEEKIVPAGARYFVCTVESMPVDRAVDFLAIDEIQLAGDPDRGHVFTDRLLKARGGQETMFLGSEVARPLLQRLVPSARVTTRPRLSRLSYAGPRKLTRLPRRTAIVAFSAEDVYAIAELVRRQRGGAAVVMGALSPRTRNAQVAMYQAGEVDYLIATDAIGMGLNMDVDHVAFAEDHKFDGRMPRRLRPAELAQIAGRAGRHMNDGTFGVTGECPPFDEEMVEAIEGHSFEALRAFYWRSGDLSYVTVRDLRRSLERRPPHPFLYRKRDGEDHQALDALARMPEVLARAAAPSRVRLLWDVCQIPDFRKSLTDSHVRLLAQVFEFLTGSGERLPIDWISQQMKRFDRTDGDIDTLTSRLAHIRTWTYITHRGDWVADPLHWQQAARAIEDRLSDALHDGLTTRFVDRRAAVLVRKLRDQVELLASVGRDGLVTVEGHVVGRIDGLMFRPDIVDRANAKPVLTAARRVLPGEIARRVRWIEEAGDGEFVVDAAGEIRWREARLARLVAGHSALVPRILVRASDVVSAAERGRVEARLRRWLDSWLAARIAPLLGLPAAVANGVGGEGPARGIAFQLAEGLGTLRRTQVEGLLKNLGEAGRTGLSRLGVRVGTEALYMPDLLKPRAVEAKALLWTVANGGGWPDAVPPAGRVNLPRADGVPDGLYLALGYLRLGEVVMRADMAERLAAAVRKSSKAGPFAVDDGMLSIAGVGREAMAAVLADLGCRLKTEENGVALFERRRSGRPPAKARTARRRGKPQVHDVAEAGDTPPAPKRAGTRRKAKPVAPTSPFAVLRDLVVAK